MRIKLGFQGLATLSALLLSVAVISGCNEEGTAPATTPSTNPAPAAGGAPAKKPETPATPPPPTTPKDEKAAEKK